MNLLYHNDAAVEFDEASHTYRIDGQLVPSVTTILGRLKPEFDAESAAERVAEREGRTVIDVLSDWKYRSLMALANGKEVHRQIEAVITTGSAPLLAPDPDGSWSRCLARIQAGAVPLAIEQIVADKELAVAGTVDAILYSRKTGSVHVCDWKPGKFKAEGYRGETLQPPFDDLAMNHLTAYSLQVSLYRLILERHGQPCGPSWIVHFGEGGATIHKAIDFRSRLEAWLKTQTTREPAYAL